MARLGAKYAEVGCKSMESFGCMSMPFGCMSMDRLGACMRLLGASMRKRLGACMRLLGASFIRLKACLTVAPGPNTQSFDFVTKLRLCNKA